MWGTLDPAPETGNYSRRLCAIACACILLAMCRALGEVLMAVPNSVAWLSVAGALALIASATVPVPAQAAAAYQVFVTNERSGDVTIIDGGDFKVVGTIPVGQRPRGIHVSPDG